MSANPASVSASRFKLQVSTGRTLPSCDEAAG